MTVVKNTLFLLLALKPFNGPMIVRIMGSKFLRLGHELSSAANGLWDKDAGD